MAACACIANTRGSNVLINISVGYGVTANIAASHVTSNAAARGSIPRIRNFSRLFTLALKTLDS